MLPGPICALAGQPWRIISLPLPWLRDANASPVLPGHLIRNSLNFNMKLNGRGRDST